MTGIDRVDLPLTLFKRGKVRDVYEVDKQLLIISSDRISAFDFVLPTLIPDKGRVLNRLSAFWFNYTRDIFPNHVVCAEPEKLPQFKQFAPLIAERAILTRKVETYPLEAIVRGYIVGSGWKSYQESGQICGIALPQGLEFAQEFPEPLFTPTTKAEQGHDQDITFDRLKALIGSGDALKIKELSISLYRRIGEYARQRGIIIADTKFEFGRDENGRIILIDEIFTPDSSRFWKTADYTAGKEPPAFDKQFVRNYLLATLWDRNSPPPPLPTDVVEKTRQKYMEIFEILTGKPL